MSLTLDQFRHFENEGYVIVEGALSEQDLDPLIGGIEAFVDERARELHEQGLITSLHANEPFERRLASITVENHAIYDEIDIMRMRQPAVFRFMSNHRLLNLVEPLVGPEITCSPIQHLRAKLPFGLTSKESSGDQHDSQNQDDSHGRNNRKALDARVNENIAPWHQDAQVHLEDADPVFVLTVWLPLCDTNEKNGCLEIIPRIHHKRTVYWSEGFGIADEALPPDDVVSLPMKEGDVLLMHKLIPHRSTANHSDSIRWSMDLRYQQTGLPTGRSFYPDFIVRSRRHPEFIFNDFETWRRGWQEALKATPNRPSRKNRPTEPVSISMYR